VNIFVCHFNKPLPKYLYEAYLKQLTKELQIKNTRFVRWQDRHAHLFGKLLLLYAFKDTNIQNLLEIMKYSNNNRPFIPESSYDFSISHSGEYVICGMAEYLRMGIDIEEIKPIDFKDFRKVMTERQWNDIKSAEESHQIFFKYWTIKECVIKADGRGLSIPLDHLEMEDSIVVYDNKKWFIKELMIDKTYSAHLALNKEYEVIIHKIDFFNEYGKCS